MKISNETVANARIFITGYFQQHLSKDYCYHDLFHTCTVVNAVNLFCSSSSVSKAEQKLLLIAAWFHDAGYVKGEKDHELESARIAAEFLEQQGIDETEIAAVKQCILATKYPQKPTNQLEAIICDADLFHLGQHV